ncbi:MAG: hypothetical protein M3Y08_18675 [Fibrobacterota bacterium]|nr:hypothetical protein [Fibrobacterota bacterium]
MGKNRKNLLWALLGAVIAIAIASAYRYWTRRDRRPGLEEACRTFREAYPEAVVQAAEVAVNEAFARSFLIRYLKAGYANGKTFEIQFMQEKETGDWVPSPALPSDLT